MSPYGQNALLTVLERLPLSAVISNAETGLILWVNAWNIQLAGATQQRQIIGHNLLEFLEPAQHGVALEAFEVASRGESPPPRVYKLRRLDGGSADVQISSVPLRWEGQPAVLSMGTDVTERERALRALADSEQRYRRLVEDSIDGIAVVAGDRLVFVNRALLSALGAEKPEMLLDRAIYDFIDPPDRKGVRASRKRLLLTGDPIARYAVTLVRLDGTQLQTIIQASVVSWEGETAIQIVMHAIADGTRPDGA